MKILKTIGSLMKVESIAECFCNTFDLHYAIIGLENHIFESDRFTKVLLYTLKDQHLRVWYL